MRAERLQVVLAEVSNTFGGAHNYWLRPDPASRTFRAAAAKSLYVSPFMPVDLDYAFAFTPPADRLVAHMETVKAGSVCFDATLSLERRPWSARGDPAGAPPLSRDDRARHGGHSLAGAEVVVEGRAPGASRHGRRRGRTRGIGRPRPADQADSVDGAMSMVTQWAKTAFLAGLRRRARRNADPGVSRPHVSIRRRWRARRDAVGARRAVLPARAHRRATSALASPSWMATGRRRTWCRWRG